MNSWLFFKTFIEIRWLRRFNTRGELEAYQRKALDKYHQFLESASPYFRRGVPGDFSTMNKAFMMEHFNELNTQGVQLDSLLELALAGEQTRDFNTLQGDIAVGLSSGTSGHRGVFITTSKERSMWAAAILAKMLPKHHLFGHRIAFFLRADNELYQTIDSALIHLEYFDSFQDTKTHLKRLDAYQPTILVAPASLLVELSSFLEKGELNIQPEKIVSVAEVLEQEDQEMIQKRFGLEPVHQVYQATEGFLGCTCEYGNLHLNEDILFVEKKYLDDTRFYPIITDFKRTSQPIFHYELNDILVENKENCPCGSVYTRIEKIEGRSDDIFQFQGKKGGVISIYPDFIRRCLLFVEGVKEYQVSQYEDRVEISLSDHREELEQAIKEQFRVLADEKDFILPPILFKEYRRDRTIKLKRVQRLVTT